MRQKRRENKNGRKTKMAGQKNGGKNITGKQKKAEKKQPKTKIAGDQTDMALKRKWQE